MCLFGNKYDPDIIDLVQYEKNCAYDKATDGTIRPAPTVTDRSDREWSVAEMDAMNRNRREAEEIYDRYKK